MIPTVSPHVMIQENDSEPRDDDVDIQERTTMFGEIDVENFEIILEESENIFLLFDCYLECLIVNLIIK